MACHSRLFALVTHSILGVVVSLGCQGCKRGARTPAPATTTPASTPATRSAASLSIDGAAFTLPRVVLYAESTGSGVTVQLGTPATDPESGNAISFDLALDDIDDPDDLPGATWHFRSDDEERAESLNGILLHGGQAMLEPMDVTIAFGREAGATTVEVDGQFRWFEPADAEKPLKVVSVTGKFPVTRISR